MVSLRLVVGTHVSLSTAMLCKGNAMAWVRINHVREKGVDARTASLEGGIYRIRCSLFPFAEFEFCFLGLLGKS